MRWLQRSELGPSISWSQSWSVIVPPRRQGTLELDTAPLLPTTSSHQHYDGSLARVRPRVSCIPRTRDMGVAGFLYLIGPAYHWHSYHFLSRFFHQWWIIISGQDLVFKAWYLYNALQCWGISVMCRYLDYNILNPSSDSVPGQWLFLHSYETIINFTS